MSKHTRGPFYHVWGDTYTPEVGGAVVFGRMVRPHPGAFLTWESVPAEIIKLGAKRIKIAANFPEGDRDVWVSPQNLSRQSAVDTAIAKAKKKKRS